MLVGDACSAFRDGAVGGSNSGQVAEWLKAPVSKTGKPARASWVRIPPCPPTPSGCASWLCGRIRCAPEIPIPRTFFFSCTDSTSLEESSSSRSVPETIALAQIQGSDDFPASGVMVVPRPCSSVDIYRSVFASGLRRRFRVT